MELVNKLATRLEIMNRLEFFILFIGFLQICAMGFMVFESYSLLDKATATVARLEVLDMQLDTIEKKIDKAHKDVKKCAKM